MGNGSAFVDPHGEIKLQRRRPFPGSIGLGHRTQDALRTRYERFSDRAGGQRNAE